MLSHLGNPPHCEFDIVPLVAARDDDGNRYALLELRLRLGPSHDELHEAQTPNPRNSRQHLVAKRREKRNVFGEQQKSVLAHDGEIGQLQKSGHVTLRHPVRFLKRSAHSQPAR